MISDEKYYQRRKADDRARRKRMTKLKADLPRRMKILAKVKNKEISLAEAQKMIRNNQDG